MHARVVDGLVETGLLSFRSSDLSRRTAVIGNDMNERMKIYIWDIKTSTQKYAYSERQMNAAHTSQSKNRANWKKMRHLHKQSER